MPDIQHRLLSGDDIHVPWREVFVDEAERLVYVLSANDVGMIFYVHSTNEVWTVEAGPEWAAPLTPGRLVTVADTTITPSSPLVLPAGSAQQISLDEGAGTFGVNADPADYWDQATSRNTVPRPHWDYTLRLDFTVATTVNQEGRLIFTIDIGGGLNVIFEDTRALFKAVGVEQKGSFIFSGYAGTTWAANGAILRLESTVAAELRDVTLVVKAR